MPDPNIRSSVPAETDQVIEAVSFFEQILQTMPEDRVALEVLSQAYEQAGDAAKACDLLARLARVIERDGDVDAAKALRSRLAMYAGTGDADAALEQLAAFLSTRMTSAAAPGRRWGCSMPGHCCCGWSPGGSWAARRCSAPTSPP